MDTGMHAQTDEILGVARVWAENPEPF